MTRNTPQWSVRDLSRPETAAAVKQLLPVEYLLLDELQAGILEVLATFPAIRADASKDELDRTKEVRTLIAAAPRLLAALRKMVFHYRELVEICTGSESSSSIDEAEALLRELEGKTA